MIICVKCKKQMKCIENGVIARYGDHHCYSGDLYRCTECNNESLHTNSTPYPDDKPLRSQDLQMP